MRLSAYFPRIVTDWQREAPSASSRVVAGTLVFMDISGFTAMSERLAKKGTIGAEEVTDVMDAQFTTLLEAAYAEGGSLLKFGGDAMLLLFQGEGHAVRGCRAAAHMRALLRRSGKIATSAGNVTLRMSVGVHSGNVHIFLVGSSHRELIVTGPSVTRTVEMESIAAAGEIMLSEETAAAIPEECRTQAPAGAWLLAKAPASSEEEAGAPAAQDMEDAERFIPVAIRARLAGASRVESEHRRAVVCFIHYEGVDERLRQEGAAGVETALAELVEIVQRAADEHGVCFLGTDIDRDGGKIILTAGAPTTSGSDEEAMLRTVRQILSAGPRLPVRIGINAGAVFAGDIGPEYRRTYTVMGDTVNLAARLMARAEPGQAITVREVIAQSRTTFETKELAPFMVKGKAQPVSAVALGERTGTRGTTTGQELPLVGREQELSLLAATIDGVREGRHGIVEVVGDAGIGKSRLVEEATQRSGLRTFEAAGEQYESTTPYFPLRRLLAGLLDVDATDPATLEEELRTAIRRVTPELEEWLPLIAMPFNVATATTPAVERVAPRFRRAQAHRVLGELIGHAAPGATMFVVEDAHWLDDATREFLSSLISSHTERPWLWVFTRRGSDEPLFAGFDEEAVTIVLEPLPPDAADALVRAALGDRTLSVHGLRDVAARAAGNPYFLRELTVLAASGERASEELPATVEGLLKAQLDRLSADEQQVLRYASVVGPVFNARRLQESFGELASISVDDTCQELSGFLERASGELYRFRHSLVRESAYASLPFRVRRDLHSRLGVAIERRLGRRSNLRAELLSLHFHRARAYDKTLEYSRIAGDRAKDKSANIEAAEFYRRAIEAAGHVGTVPAEELAQLYESLGDVCEVAAMYSDATRAFTNARRCMGSRGETRRLLRKEGIVRERLGQYTQALRWYGRGLQIEDVGDARELHQLQLAYAGVRFRQGRYRECAMWCERVIRSAEAGGDRASLAHAYYLLDHSHTMLGSADAGTFRALALPIFEELGDLTGQANVLNNLGVSASIDGEWDEALEYFRRSREARERVGDVVGAATATNNIGEVLLDRGSVTEAEPLFREALQVWKGAGYKVGIGVATSALGLAATRDGRFEEGRAWFDEALAQFREIKAESFVQETQGRMVELRLAEGDAAGALSLADGLLAKGDDDEMATLRMQLLRLRGLALLRLDRRADAAEAVSESVTLARAMSNSYELALSLEAQARLARRRGDGDADGLLRESSAILRRLGVVTVPLTGETERGR